jgi:hypothetical protein
MFLTAITYITPDIGRSVWITDRGDQGHLGSALYGP